MVTGTVVPGLTPYRQRAVRSIGIALLVLTTMVGCTRRPQPTSPVEQAPSAQAPLACPQGHGLRQVYVLVGLPTQDMVNRFRRGEALLAGCIGNPNQPEAAFVCETCKQWKTATMAYWQPLPKDFGADRR